MVLRRRIVQRPNLVDRVCQVTETEMVLEFDNHRDLVALPTARQPPPRIRVDKYTTSLRKIILDSRKQFVARPTATRPNRLPTAITNRGKSRTAFIVVSLSVISPVGVHFFDE